MMVTMTTTPLVMILVCALAPLYSSASLVLGCPTACFCDDNGEYVSCVGEGPWEVPASVPRTAVRLELRNYQIPTLSSKDLEGMLELQELKLQQTMIRSIENETFANLVKLQRLELSENLMENLTSSTFEGLARLRFLDLSSNVLVNVEEAFVHLSNVEQLNLRANRIPRLTSKSFLGLQKVQYLNIDSNQISSIEVGAFQYLTNLAHLILSNNPLTKLARLDFFGTRLQYIDVSNIGMVRIPQSLTRFVRDLRLARNNLSHISTGDFDSYPYLGLLVLDDNQITEIESDSLGRQEYLMRLWINGNKLSRIPANLPPSLQALYIEENHLTSIQTYAFKGLFKLEQLFLQRNQIKELDRCAFCDLVNLKSLDLQANRIENLTEGVFANLSRLQTLDLSQNNLKVLDSKCFSGMDKLTTLQMSRMAFAIQFQESIFDPLKSLQTLEMYDSSAFVHQITNSTRVLHSLRGLTELNIMHNKLTYLRPDFPSFFPQLKNIKMTGNNWHCDRNVLWLSTWIKTTSVQFYRSYSIRCASPEQFQYRPIMLLTEDDFAQTTTTTTTTPSTTPQASPPSSSSTNTTDTTILPFASLIPVFQTIYLVRTEQPTSTKPSSKTNTYESRISANVSSSTTTEASQTSYTQTSSSSRIPSSTQMTALNVTTDSSTLGSIDHENASRPVGRSSADAKPATTPITEDTSVNDSANKGNNTHRIPTFSVSQTQTNETTAVTGTTSTTDSLRSAEGSSSEPPIHAKSQTHNITPIKTNASSASETKKRNRISENNLNLVHNYPPNKLKGVFIAPVLHAHRAPATHGWDQTTAVIISSSLVGGCLLVVGAILIGISGAYKCRGNCFASKKLCQVRRSSSISYCPQRDEISIVTVSEGTVGLQTSTHHGLGNKLYYMMEIKNGGPCDPTKEALPDPQLQELLPRSLKENGYISDNSYIVK